MQPKKNWFLRKKDGSEYGPVSVSDLLRWSAQCRIVAGNAVSMDREEWIPVEEIPELEMHWMAHRADGKEYGPFALAAVQELFTHNVLPADAILINRLTGENKPLTDVIILPEAGGQQQNGEPQGQAPDQPSTDDAADGSQETAETGTTEKAGETAVEKVTAEESTAEEESMGTQEEATEAPLSDNAVPVDDAPLGSAAESTDEVDLTDSHDRVDKVDVKNLHAQIDVLRQELRDAQTETTEISEAYLAKIAILEKKLQNAQQAARDATARQATLEAERLQSQPQAGDDLADLRKQTAFMKKNIAALHGELDEARRQATLRAKVILALGSLLTLIAALFIMRAAGGGCRQREDIGTTTRQDNTETVPATGGETRPVVAGATAANATNTWPTLLIDGLRVDRKQDHLVVRFDDGAFASLTNFTPSAAGQLKTLADQLRPDLPRLRIVVEGHSDDTPMRATAAFADNAALAAARAETGAAFLKREGARAIAATNAGPPPYPNDTPENRRRNRTLLIKVYRQ